MKRNRQHRRRRTLGVSLVETIVAMGTLAVVVPLVLGAMIRAGQTGRSARAETRAPAVADQCLAELQAARNAESAILGKLDPAEPLPSGGVFLAFGREGRLLGESSGEEFASGVDEVEGEEAFYLAKIEGEREENDGRLLMELRVSVEYPAVMAEKKRNKIPFHTRLP